MNIHTMTNWIESRGGPLLLVPRSALDNWRGIRSEADGVSSDYDRACEISDLVELLAVGPVDALALGDEPLPTSWIATATGGYFVRWVYADSKDDVDAYLRTLTLEDLPAPDLCFCTPGSCVLFDSAEPGNEILGPSLDVPLRPGCYDVSTKQLDPSKQIRLLVHVLTWRSVTH